MRSLILAKGLHPSWASGEASFVYSISRLLLNEIYTKVKIALENRDLISKEASKLVRDKFSLQAVKIC
jgi:hypothetical protein